MVDRFGARVHPHAGEIVKDALRALPSPSRRLFLKRGLTLGGLSMLTGCAISDDESVQKVLSAVSRLNDRAQAALFDPALLAPEYPEATIVRPFPFNAFYSEAEVPQVDGDGFRLEVGGRVADKRPWTLAQLGRLGQRSQVTRHICVEGWSAIGKWSGVPLGEFLRRVGADLHARYVDFRCADGYRTSIDMPSALHPQTIIALDFDDQRLPAKYGYPMKIRIPTKLGYKNPKHVHAVHVTDVYPGGYWEDQGYNWFGGS